MHAEAARYADALRASGAGRGDRVLLMLPDGPELVAAFLGALLQGTVPAVLNPRLSTGQLRFVLGDSGARVLLVDGALVDVGTLPARTEAPQLAEVVVAGGEAGRLPTLSRWLAGRVRAVEPQPMSPQDMAYWIYTSGTTGRPKAVVHRQGDAEVANRHLHDNLGLAPGERIYTTSKLFFAFALGHSLLGGLRSAATVVLHPGWPEPGGIARVIGDTRPHVVCSVPTLYRALLHGGHAAAPGFRSVRHYVSAGEALPEMLMGRWHAVTGVHILEGIGTSETTFLFIANTPSAHRPGSTGRVLPWAQARLLGEDGAEVHAAGEPGVLWVRIGSMFSQYWNQPEKTRSVKDGEWYCTEDMFERDEEGWWTYRGRHDDMLKISGQWVSPTDVEQAALETPEVDDAAVVGCVDGDGLTRLVLFAVPAPGQCACATLDAAIVTGLRERLPHNQCPREIRYVDSIPRTATGKIKRFELRERLSGAGGGS